MHWREVVDDKTPIRLPGNTPGDFFVSDACDGCAYCGLVAPENFDFDKESNTYHIGRQPEDAEELDLVREAMEDCPVDAIHEENK
jgi:ferredoxin